jgi:hypothetical protein
MSGPIPSEWVGEDWAYQAIRTHDYGSLWRAIEEVLGRPPTGKDAGMRGVDDVPPVMDRDGLTPLSYGNLVGGDPLRTGAAGGDPDAALESAASAELERMVAAIFAAVPEGCELVFRRH